MFRKLFGYTIKGEAPMDGAIYDLGWRPFRFMAVQVANSFIADMGNDILFVADVYDSRKRLVYSRGSV